MEEILTKEFKDSFKEDIEDILNEINKYLPNLKTWQLNQSVILDSNKQVLCKSLFNNKEEKIGYQISINILDETTSKYRLLIKKNSLELIKTYNENNNNIMEHLKIELDKVRTKRMCIYEENKKNIKYNEYSELGNNKSTKSFEEIMLSLKEVINQKEYQRLRK